MKYLFLIICITIYQINTEEWFQKNNPHFINQHQFNQFVTNQNTRKSGITFVKFFTPWCRYCRFIKDIFDKLKNEEWNIHFYDMNCGEQNNVMFCSRNGVTSFPHINIYQNGQYREAINGYYPEHVIRQIFNKYNTTKSESKPQSQKKPQNSKQNQQHKNQVKTNQQGINYIEPEIVVTPVQQQPIKQEQKKQAQQKKQIKETKQETKKQQVQKQDQKEKQQIKGQTVTEQARQEDQNIVVTDNNIEQTQKERQIIQEVNQKDRKGQNIDPSNQVHKHKNSTSYINYMIYGICILGGLYYFSHIMKNPVEHSNEQHNNQNEPLVKSKQKNSINFEQSELIEQPQFSHNERAKNQNQDIQYIVEVEDQDL